MNDLLHNLIEALREELKQYGEMLAVLEQQQDSVVQRQVNELLQNISQGAAQGDIITAVRHERGQHQRNVARLLDGHRVCAGANRADAGLKVR
ncbi:MAG TPA: flagellar export chaperone FlgN, partial [Candidatus Acidoferrum sp.]|nr:flagellar export chaperone FlgN [Candidatus Acidoferrum sp.]